jgi:hypothetical protein
MKYFKKINNSYFFSTGLTLVEVLVSLGILVFIGLGISTFGRDIFSLNSGLQNNLNAQFEGRKVLKTIITELRSASPSSLGSYPILQAGTSSLIFYSNIDADAYKERLRYFLDGTELKRGVIKPSGNPLTYSSGSEEVRTIINNVRNGTSTPVFLYFDSQYTGTSSPLSEPVSVTDIRLIKIDVMIDKDLNRHPGPINISSQGTLRNVKDNL